MAPSDGYDSNTDRESSASEYDWFSQPSQTEVEIVDYFEKNYGKLNRSDFINDIVKLCTMDQLVKFRASMYELALHTIPSTPSGQLRVRKDTQNNGGKSAAEKMADDLYILLQYHQGDNNMDIASMFTEKCRKKTYRRASMLINSGRSNGSTDNIVQKSSPSNNVGDENYINMREFCTQVLTEMRSDRDLLVNEIAALKRDNGLLSKVHDDIRYIKDELAQTRDRISKIEALNTGSELSDEWPDVNVLTRKYNQVTKSMKRMQRRTGTIESSINNIKSSGNDVVAQMGKNHATLTQRMNDMQLTQAAQNHKSPSSSSVDPVQRRPEQDKIVPYCAAVLKTSIPTPPRNPEQNSISPSNTHSQQQASGNNTSNRTVRLDTTSSNHLNITLQKDINNPPSTSSDGRYTSVPRPTRSQVSTSASSSSQASNAHTAGEAVKSKKKGLRGFVPRERRQRYQVFFVSGIMINDDSVDVTIDNIYSFLDDYKCRVSSMRHLKHSRYTMSVKLVVYEESARMLSGESFWPEGIQCREWQE
jgi:hypothetical protein